MTAGDRRAGWVAAVATLACLAPFLGKAFHVDDPLFVWMARHIQAHPLDPYGFAVNWYGVPASMVEIMRGPPLASYGMALVALITGWSEIGLHAAFALAAVAVVLGTYRVARRLCDAPLTAALIALASPVFLVSATTVMCDVVMLGFWTWAMAQWIDGLHTGDRRRLVLAVVLAAACVLTKYNGITLLPLLLVYAVAWRKRLDRHDGLLVFPLLVLVAWLGIMVALYGTEDVRSGLSLAAAVGGSGIAQQLVVTLSFAGGCFIAVLFYAPVMWPVRVLLCTLAVFPGAVWWVSGPGDHAPVMLQGVDVSVPTRAMQLCLFVVAGLHLVGLAVTDVARRRDAGAWLLASWVVGTLAFAGFVAWAVSGRYVLPIAPAAGILLARRLEERSGGGRRRRLAVLPLAASAAVALAVAWGDAALANTSRMAAAEIYARYAESHPALWFEGHWGFQYYMEEQGAKAIDVRSPGAVAGEVVVMPLNNSNLYEIPPRFVARSETLEWQPRAFATTVSLAVGAGFYSAAFGPMPFVFGKPPAERYVVITLGTPTAMP